MGLRRRPHQSLAAVGVAALVRLIVAAGDRMSANVWIEAIGTLAACADDTRPAVRELVESVRPSLDGGGGSIPSPGTPAPTTPAAVTAVEGSPWDAKSPGDSPRGAVPARSDSVSGERRQVSTHAPLLFIPWLPCSRNPFCICSADCHSSSCHARNPLFSV